MTSDREASWQVTYMPANGQPAVAGFGRTLAVASANCLRSAETEYERASERAGAVRAEVKP